MSHYYGFLVYAHKCITAIARCFVRAGEINNERADTAGKIVGSFFTRRARRKSEEAVESRTFLPDGA